MHTSTDALGMQRNIHFWSVVIVSREPLNIGASHMLYLLSQLSAPTPCVIEDSILGAWL